MPSIKKRSRSRVPSYRQRSGYTQALVTLTDAVTKKRRDFWLGEFNTPESRERYHRLIAAWEANGRGFPRAEFAPSTETQVPQTTVVEVIREYWRWAEAYYRPKHAQALIGALTLLRQFYGRTAAADFGPQKLRLLRDEMIRGDEPNRKPWSRKYINAQVQRLRHMFKWAASRELVSASVHESLRTIEPLRRGRTTARETDKIVPVSQPMLDAVIPHLYKPVRAVVQLQLLTGARPGELLAMRPCDLEFDKPAGLWVYRPEQHKNAFRERERTIYLGPKAQGIIKEFLTDRATNDFLFSPKDSVAERNALRQERRKTGASCGNRPGTNRQESPQRAPGCRYTTGSYNRAVQYSCDRAFPPPGDLAKRVDETTKEWRTRLKEQKKWKSLLDWRRAHRFHVNQLRHSAATSLRREFGLEAAQLVLGHASANVTDAVYAERDRGKVIEVMRNIG